MLARSTLLRTRLVTSPRPATLNLCRRAYSLVTAPPREEHFHVPCRSNGSIKLDVYHALDASSPVLIYLPPGPVVPHDPNAEQAVIAALRASTAATIVCINYRASSDHPFPTPYHDVLYGYDWVQDNLLVDASQKPYPARLAVCGELMGGSIATMLALTECRIGESRIVAAAVNNPIVDWAFPDDLPQVSASELPEPASTEETSFPTDQDMMASFKALKVGELPKKAKRKRKPKAVPLTSWQAWADSSVIPTLPLAEMRSLLFRRQEDMFDRFASPIHFFRSPHAQLLTQQPQGSPLIQPDYALDLETQMSLTHFESFNDQNAPEPLGPPELTRCRSYARVYPQSGVGKVSLPAWNITTGAQSPLLDQATELTKVIRRSIARHAIKSQTGRMRAHDPAEKLYYEEYAESRVLFDPLPKTGLWSQTHAERTTHLEKVGGWVKTCLAPESS